MVLYVSLDGWPIGLDFGAAVYIEFSVQIKLKKHGKYWKGNLEYDKIISIRIQTIWKGILYQKFEATLPHEKVDSKIFKTENYAQSRKH